MVNGRRVGETVGFDIAHGRLTEEAFVLAGELARALISDFKSGSRGIQSLYKHSFTSRPLIEAAFDIAVG